MYWRKLYVVPLVITLVLAGAFLLAGVISGPGAARTFSTQGPQSHVGSYASAQGSSPQKRVLHESDVPGEPAIQPDPAKVGLGPSAPAYRPTDEDLPVEVRPGIR